MDGTHRAFVIIGGGPTGAGAARTLREEGFAGRVILIGDEHEHPYARPPLSKGYLTGRTPREALYVHPPGWYAHHRIELHLGEPAVAIDRAGRAVRLGDGTRLPYDALLLATGAEPCRLGIPGTGLAGVHHLRRLAHADHLRGLLTAPGTDPLVIAGAGWTGLEVAAAARELGSEVTVVEPGPAPLHALLGEGPGGALAGLHRERGVAFRFGTRLKGISGRHGMVAAVHTEDGRELPARAVFAAIGAGPRTALAAAAGLELAAGPGGGIAVDASLRTSDPRIFAAGGAAAVPAVPAVPGGRRPGGHWADALRTGPAAARAMLGRPAVWDRVPYVNSEQHGVRLEYSGFAPPGTYDRFVCRGDVRRPPFVACWLREGRLLAGLTADAPQATGPLRELIRAGNRLDPGALADPGIRLDALLPG